MDSAELLRYFRGELFITADGAKLMNDRTDLFQTLDFGDGILRIQGSGSVFCYLVRGTERALLIDTMTGLGNLRFRLNRVTDLPVTVVCTHGHFDHIGGTADFPTAWIPRGDAVMLQEQQCSERKYWLENMLCTLRRLPLKFSHEDFTPAHGVVWRGLCGGKTFDLGGRIVTAVDIPGHTVGSTGYLDSKTGTLFVGDAGSRSTYLFLHWSRSVEGYLEGLLRLKDRWGSRIKRWFNFHNYTEMPADILDDLINACRCALHGKITGQKFRGTELFRFVYPVDKKWRRLDGGYGNIIVRLDRLRMEDEPF